MKNKKFFSDGAILKMYDVLFGGLCAIITVLKLFSPSVAAAAEVALYFATNTLYRAIKATLEICNFYTNASDSKKLMYLTISAVVSMAIMAVVAVFVLG